MAYSPVRKAIPQLCTLMMCGSRLLQMLKHRHPMCDAIVAFICITGLVENVIFSPIAAMPTIAWIIALVWWKLEDAPAVTSPTGEAQYA